MTYTEQLREREQRLAAAPRREYITNDEFRKLKAALTRAKNSGDPAKVLATVESAVELFNSKVWPDDWPMWRIALWDARALAEQNEDDELAEELHAASILLFD